MVIRIYFVHARPFCLQSNNCVMLYLYTMYSYYLSNVGLFKYLLLLLYKYIIYIKHNAFFLSVVDEI